MAALVEGDQAVYFQFLSSTPDEYLIEFCKLALEYLKDGPNEKKYNTAAQKLDKSPEFIRRTIETILCFLFEATRFHVTQKDFESLSTLGFSENQIEILWQFIQNKQETVRQLLTSNQNAPHFRELDWRLETVISSRSLLKQCTPQITIKLHLDHETTNENKDKLSKDTGSTQRQIVMKLDPGALRGIIESLDQALLESKSHRTRLFTRAFQNSK